MKRLIALFFSFSVIAMNPTHAQSTAHPVSSTSADYKIIVEAARTNAVRDLNQEFGLEPEVVNIADDWAFVIANLVDSHGAAFRYRGTPLEEAAAAGGVSSVYAGLLRRRDGAWSLVTQVIGPTDVAWEDWSGEFGAPATLFTAY